MMDTEVLQGLSLPENKNMQSCHLVELVVNMFFHGPVFTDKLQLPSVYLVLWSPTGVLK